MLEISISARKRAKKLGFPATRNFFLTFLSNKGRRKVTDGTKEKEMHRISGDKPDWVGVSLAEFDMWTIVRSCSLEVVKPLDDVTFRSCVGVVQRARGGGGGRL